MVGPDDEPVERLERHFTLRAMAERLSISVKTLRRAVTAGELKVARFGNDAIRVPESEAVRYAEAALAKPASKTDGRRRPT